MKNIEGLFKTMDMLSFVLRSQETQRATPAWGLVKWHQYIIATIRELDTW